MRRLAVVVLAVVGLAACAESKPQVPSSVDDGSAPQGGDHNVTAWFSTEDNGHHFRCLYVYRTGYKKGGPAIWCYEDVGGQR